MNNKIVDIDITNIWEKYVLKCTPEFTMSIKLHFKLLEIYEGLRYTICEYNGGTIIMLYFASIPKISDIEKQAILEIIKGYAILWINCTINGEYKDNYCITPLLRKIANIVSDTNVETFINAMNIDKQ